MNVAQKNVLKLNYCKLQSAAFFIAFRFTHHNVAGLLVGATALNLFDLFVIKSE